MVSYCSSTLKLDRPPALGLDYARRHLLILTPSGVDNGDSSTLFFEYAVPESFRVGPVRRSSRTGLPTRLRGSCLARQPPRSTWAYTSREGICPRSRASTAAALWVHCAFLRRAQESAECDTLIMMLALCLPTRTTRLVCGVVIQGSTYAVHII
ncbi:hypothetical protein L226DRAFT_322604 [Lentinus tigrinus ALCF2SS1-7]|uniref:uncharacterized protein n=1 Tax=Lentinus tigrinus ALCF2SS1-7 TaxID=1328758 RepID=UPI0011660E8A|nr:hypothetical protein L226DRAFT_322604 [Lentinus tigrinus ALCF2SS1-7]